LAFMQMIFLPFQKHAKQNGLLPEGQRFCAMIWILFHVKQN